MDPNVRWLGVGAAVRATGISLILPFLALYLRNILGLGYVEIGVLVALLGILPIAIYPFGGAIADRLGRRWLFLGSLMLEAGSVIGTGAAMRAGLLAGVLGFALLVSLAGALGGPALSAYVADLTVGSDRTRGFTWLRIGWNLGFTVGAFSGGALIGFLGFSMVGFLAGAVLVGSTALLVGRLQASPYDRDRAAGRPRPSASTDPAVPTRATWRTIAHDRVFLVVSLTFAVAYLSVNQWSTTFPLYANTVLGLPYAVVGIGLALNGVLVVVAQAPTTRAAIGHRHTTLLLVGALLYVGGFLLFGTAALVPGLVLVGFLAAVVVLTMGENVMSIPYSTLPSNLAPSGEIGAYNGAFFAISGIGLTLATTFGGLVLSLGLSPPVTWGILMLPALPALAIGYPWIARRVPAVPNRA
ncbi:MAG TPA: MFS transporter [Thermoplasmata archaeon]|jgi:MFS family permease|nr:MFS transporter [Thermoplasmata archaeon]